MEYFVLNEGVRQGPFDLIGMIKKIKNGTLAINSLISANIDGPYTEAGNLPEVAKLIEEHSNPTADINNNTNLTMTLKASFQEGVELWVRRILDYTLIAGAIMAVGFSLRALFQPLMGANSMFPYYLASVLVMAAFFEFCYYVLETKRNHKVDIADFIAVIKRTLPQFLGFSVLLSLFMLGYGVSTQLGLLATLVMLVVITVFAFTPFIATDSNMGVMRSAKLSFQKVTNIGADNFGVILAIVSINLFAALLPGMLMQDLFGLGLFISLPVTISALAYVYDQIFV